MIVDECHAGEVLQFYSRTQDSFNSADSIFFYAFTDTILLIWTPGKKTIL